MGRKRRKNVYQYFIYNEDSKTSKCKISGCGQILKGHHGANLLRHFYNQHRSKYEEIQKLNEGDKENLNPNLTDNQDIVLSVIDNCSDLVAVHGRPFALIEDEAFRKLLTLIPGMTGTQMNSINIRRIKSSIEEKPYTVRKKFCDEVQNKLIALKVDVASLKSRRFLGLNIQYICKGKIVLRNIGIMELHQRNTADFLKDCVTLMLSRFGIEFKQLYSITTDNGANMLSMVKKIDESIRETETFESLEDETDFDDNDYYQNIIDNLEFDLGSSEQIHKVTAVRCAAHTLQLAVRDALNEHVDLLDQCRRVARTLRTPNYALQLRENNFLQPIVDCPIRWDSTADMLERLINLKIFCQNNPLQNNIEENTWAEIENVLRSLLPCRKLSKSLQQEQLTFGCFYIAWVQCMLEIEKKNDPFALLLGICMRQRQAALFENDCFLNAVYLDPRINAILTDEQNEVAQNNLKRTYYRLQQLSSTSTGPTTPQINEPQPSISSSSDVDIFLESQFNQRRFSGSGHGIDNDLRLQLSNSIISFSNQQRLPSNTDILTYWEGRKLINPQLYLLANTALATPPTQVSVERLFSSLKFVVNNLRIPLLMTYW